MRPVYPQPGYDENDLELLLASRQFVFADCYTITLVDGTTKLRYTTAQNDVSVVVIDEVIRRTFDAKKVLISGLRFKIGIGVEVDEQTVTFAYDEYQEIYGQKFAYALRLGWLDGATISRDRYFAQAWGDPWIAGMPLFTGRVSTLESVGRVEAKVKVKSALVLLNIEMPRFMWQPACLNTLYDVGCGIDENAHAETVVLGPGSTTTILYTSSAADIYKLGKIYIEDDDAVTRVRSINDVVAGSYISLSYPLDFTPESGQQFVMYEGCDRTYATCGDQFSNQANFRGYPYVPVAETAA